MGAGVGCIYHSLTHLRRVTIAAVSAEETWPLDVFHGRHWVSEDYGFECHQCLIEC